LTTADLLQVTDIREASLELIRAAILGKKHSDELKKK